jgi:hypothetical protein
MSHDDRDQLRVMLDSNVHDAVVASARIRKLIDTLTVSGRIVLISTHIQDDELSRIGDQDKRDAVLSIKRENVPTSAAMWDISRWDECKWGDEDTNEKTRALTKGNPKHAEDALIGVTAADEADVLVTDDDRFAKRVIAAKLDLQVWSFADFVSFLEELLPE